MQTPFSQTYFHGTKAELRLGDFIEVGLHSNYGQNKAAKLRPGAGQDDERRIGEIKRTGN
ncbi:MAG: NAD(+)--rifampin ADP-ribosyltransferase [Saprospiraceae bacterium]|nr:NAD(+)--rifampin ADP-ribosyltransferase [Saprospiraceae bacterium]